jgi:hypothetical protein
MIEESTTSRNWTAHSSSSVSMPRRVASNEAGGAVAGISLQDWTNQYSQEASRKWTI